MDKTTERIICYGVLFIGVIIAILIAVIKEQYDNKWQYTSKGNRIALRLKGFAEYANLIYLIGIIITVLYTIINFGVLGWIGGK